MGQKGAQNPDTGSPWYQETTCPDDSSTTISYPPGPDFTFSNTDNGIGKGIAKSGLIADRNGSLSVLLRGSPRNIARIGSRGWIVNGPDFIGVSIGITSSETVDEATTGTMTVLVNYKAVQAEWELIGSSDTEIAKSHTGAGFQFNFDEKAEVVNVRIPYEAFSEPGFYEVVLWYQVSGPNQYILGSGSRLSLWNQTASRQPHPCNKMVESRPISESERAVMGFLTSAETISYASDESGVEHLQTGITVAPSSPINVEYFVPSTARFRDEEYNVAIFPMLNGALLEPAKFIRRPTGRIDGSIDPTYFDTLYSSSIEFMAPEEPGVHDFSVGMVLDPFQPRALPDGTYGRSFPREIGRAVKLRINVEE